MADTVQGRTLAEQVYEGLRREILTGELAPGDRLRVESIKVRHGFSGTTVREALTKLAGERLVTFEGQRGFHVAPISIEDFEDLCHTRRLVEIEAMRLSLMAADADWEARVESAYEALSTVESQWPATQQEVHELWEVRNREFHAALLSNCASPWLHRIYDLLIQQAERYRRITLTRG